MIYIDLDTSIEEQEAIADAVRSVLGLLPHQNTVWVDEPA